jgi:hypothetical protein
MDKLLTKKDLAERWQVSERTIDDYRLSGIITPIKGLPCIRFNPQYIAEIEGVTLEKFSPLEKRRLEREIEEWKQRAERAEKALAKVNMIITKAIYVRAKGVQESSSEIERSLLLVMGMNLS